MSEQHVECPECAKLRRKLDTTQETIERLVWVLKIDDGSLRCRFCNVRAWQPHLNGCLAGEE